MSQHIRISRRQVVAAGVAGTAGVFLVACSSGDSGSSGTTASDPGPIGSQSPSAQATQPGTAIIAISKVPTDGAVIQGTDGDAFVVSKTRAGDVACFSAICPHEGCLCNRVEGDQAVCPCHGSSFDVFTGEVTKGPATTGLAKVESYVEGDQVFAR